MKANAGKVATEKGQEKAEPSIVVANDARIRGLVG
jgi:hypothetical protein